MKKTLKQIARIIIDDKDFINDIKVSLDNILKDGKIDVTDIPEMMLLIVLAYNKSTKFTVSYHELAELLTEITRLIITKYNLVPTELETQFEKISQTSISLILLMPKIRATCTSCFGK